MDKITKKININFLERKIFWTVFITLIILIGFYLYFVNKTILNIVERENTENNLVALNSKISELEFEYLSLKKDIDLEYAYKIGFVDVRELKFASRKLPGQSLSLRGE